MIRHRFNRILYSIYSFLLIKEKRPIIISTSVEEREERRNEIAKSFEKLLNRYLLTRMGCFGCDIIDGPMQFDKKVLMTYGEDFELADISHDIRTALVGGRGWAVWVRVLKLPKERIEGITTLYPYRVMAGSFRKKGAYPDILEKEI